MKVREETGFVKDWARAPVPGFSQECKWSYCEFALEKKRANVSKAALKKYI